MVRLSILTPVYWSFVPHLQINTLPPLPANIDFPICQVDLAFENRVK